MRVLQTLALPLGYGTALFILQGKSWIRQEIFWVHIPHILSYPCHDPPDTGYYETDWRGIGSFWFGDKTIHGD
jgi:hypothetical protein